MIFNSIDFILFFPVVLILYWISGHKLQNRLLLVASLFFYGFWDWRFLGLLVLSSLVDFVAGLGIEKFADNPKKKKAFLIFSLISNLSVLGFFKYFNFFIENAVQFLSALGLNPDIHTLQIILPLGISFYTFQTLSYTIDVYRGELKPVRDIFDFALYVSFFPQLVAGPIERATRLLPQIQLPRQWNPVQFREGAFLILLGYFKKVFVADNIGDLVNSVFGMDDPSGGKITIALLAFFFQIYCDFSGYSDIARGLSKWLGFELMRNFNLPIFAVNIIDLYKRWHISLMSWLRDYIYLPLGGNRVSATRQHINNLFIFFISGLWHGASWNFIIWGLYNGILTSMYRILSPYFPKFGYDHIPAIYWTKYAFKATLTFCAFAFSGIWFRSESFEQSKLIFHNLFFEFGAWDNSLFQKLIRLTALLILVEISQFKSNDEFSIFKWKLPFRVGLYVALFYSILILGNFNKNEFIYFVF
ncbi:MBOAT family O-acyltransferase [Leptospira sp. GIMC2001]|uniref:MBOAT family O-acyltransferase n=1 Tax=Leptospira sp. GIMC2001 TaxID=1513297 RepID=UPI00234A919B|nr:MBOAT family O-acyltransferase [Leptospira sp. GIMC2001]WCL50874.1 MBOAT family protein [Leptospira sp. GIMC2001]